MTVNSTTRKTSPFIGNNLTTQLPFGFMVFAAADILVTLADSATGVETVLTLGTDYSVTLNSNQASNPGGNVNLAVALATGKTAVVSSQVQALQKTDITNAGGFYPEIIEAALDKQMIVAQQLAEKVDRCAKLPITSEAVDLEQLTFDIVRVAESADSIDTVSADLVNIDAVAGSIGNVNTVAGSIGNVNAVGQHISNVVTVSADLANIDTVVGKITDVSTVSGKIADVSAVASDLANINAAAANKTNIDTVAGSIGNVNAVGQQISSVVAVAPSISKVVTVAGSIGNVNTVAGSIGNVNAVGQHISNVVTVSADLANIDTVVANIAAIIESEQNALDAAQAAADAANASRLVIGSVTTSDSGAPAGAEIVGNAGAQSLNLTLPRGEKGERGESANSSLITNFVDTPIGQVFFVKTPDRTGTVIEYYDALGTVRFKKYELTGAVYAFSGGDYVATAYFPNGSPNLAGSKFIESVYVGAACYANVSGASGGADRIYLPFAYSAYEIKTVSANGAFVTVGTTSSSGLKHGAIMSSVALSTDIVSFSDGGCTVSALKTALLAGAVPVLDPALATPASVPADAIEISFVQHNNWLRCYGQTVNTADYPLLAKAWGITASTFTIPAIENSDISIANPINPDLMAFVVAA